MFNNYNVFSCEVKCSLLLFSHVFVYNEKVLRIYIKVEPNSKDYGVRYRNDMLIVNVKEPAEKGKANEDLIRYLAERLGVAKGCLRIVSGHKSKLKLIEFACDLTEDEIHRRLL